MEEPEAIIEIGNNSENSVTDKATQSEIELTAGQNPEGDHSSEDDSNQGSIAE